MVGPIRSMYSLGTIKDDNSIVLWFVIVTMNESKQSERPDSIEDVHDRLGDTRRSILEAIRAVGGEGDTATVKRSTEAAIPEGSTRYHFRWLEEEGLIVEVGRRDVSHGGKDAIVWELTDAGADLLERIDKVEGREDRPQTIEGLNDRIDSLEDEVSQLKDVVRTALDDELRTIISEEVAKELEKRQVEANEK
ncbi:hypothetical protein [Haloterrigena salifodinae]|uniref:hypothetical protein n=1 Tax=Haloterrigena salifodinae TaxID=2675099 RepID=UPI000F88F316|nr:hypothetical protein [Haloterrigena salifodinae]